MKRVTYEVAKFLDKEGFEPEDDKYIYLDGTLYTKEEFEEMDCGGPFSFEISECETLVAPPYTEVWNWLWEKKGINIDVQKINIIMPGTGEQEHFINNWVNNFYSNPEDALAGAVEYLVNNNKI